jgi:hypothetical protein
MITVPNVIAHHGGIWPMSPAEDMTAVDVMGNAFCDVEIS